MVVDMLRKDLASKNKNGDLKDAIKMLDSNPNTPLDQLFAPLNVHHGYVSAKSLCSHIFAIFSKFSPHKQKISIVV